MSDTPIRPVRAFKNSERMDGRTYVLEVDYLKRKNELIEARLELAAKDATIEKLRKALESLFEEYDDRAAQFGSDILWKKHEDPLTITIARKALTDSKS